jgi:hypothetical protein
MHNIEMASGLTSSSKLYIAGMPKGAANSTLERVDELKAMANVDFQGLHGTVTVGPLEEVTPQSRCIQCAKVAASGTGSAPDSVASRKKSRRSEWLRRDRGRR